MLKQFLAARCVRVAEAVLGRQRLVRGARFVTRQARLDVPNLMSHNGERLLQAAALSTPLGSAVYVDVGAHYGEWTSSLLQAAGDAVLEVHCFEPSPFSHQLLEENTRQDDRVTTHNVGLSDVPGDADLLVVHPGAGSNSLIAFADSGLHATATERITLNTLDRFRADMAIDRIAMLKIDAEGHDLAVLRGAIAALRQQAVDIVQFEYNHRWIDARCFLRDAFELLMSAGYTVGKVTPRGIEIYQAWHWELETFIEANFVGLAPSVVQYVPSIPWWNASATRRT